MESAAITLLETLLPPSGDSRPESGTKFSTSPFTSSTPCHFRGGPHREDGFPCPDKKTRCTELFSAVLTKKHRVLTKKDDAPNDSLAPPAEFIAVSTIGVRF